MVLLAVAEWQWEGKTRIMEYYLGRAEQNRGVLREGEKVPRHSKGRMGQECQRNGCGKQKRSTEENIPKRLPQHHCVALWKSPNMRPRWSVEHMQSEP